jgi:hypothetical protein
LRILRALERDLGFAYFEASPLSFTYTVVTAG